MNGGIVEGGCLLDGIGCVVGCSVIGCWRCSTYYHHCQGQFEAKRTYKQCKTSLAVIVHNNKPQEDNWTKNKQHEYNNYKTNKIARVISAVGQLKIC
jgi:hypothetical protein